MQFNVNILLVLIALLASILQGSTGFGYSILSMSLMPLLLPYRTAVTVTATSGVAIMLLFAVKLRRQINLKLMLYPFLSSTATSLAGIVLLMATPDVWMRRALGGVLFLLSLYFIFFSSRLRIARSRKNGLIAGAVSGLMSGLFNLGGPPMVVYFLSAAEDKLEYHATLQCYFAANGILILLLHALIGDYNPEVFRFSSVSLAGAAVGCLAGYALFRRMTMNMIRRLVYFFMAAFGIYLLLGG
ncbi:sulfite exporter TauE/SafE family protein [Caproicibacter sp.]|uniref:sulfite exporter TauE/SafE family protein n=1 Tax=Caproicibacter sp. TaxID=2814884 RepID=UPI003989EB07